MLRKSTELVADAETDFAVIEKIVESADDRDLLEFRSWFMEIFGRQNSYKLNNNDISVEFKAFILVVCLTLINVKDVEGEDDKDLLPFLKTFLGRPKFSMCHSAVGTIFFGISQNQVRNKFCALNVSRCITF